MKVHPKSKHRKNVWINYKLATSFPKIVKISITRVCWCEIAVLPWMVMNIENCHILLQMMQLTIRNKQTKKSIPESHVKKKNIFINQVQNEPLSSVTVDLYFWALNYGVTGTGMFIYNLCLLLAQKLDTAFRI